MCSSIHFGEGPWGVPKELQLHCDEHEAGHRHHTGAGLADYPGNLGYGEDVSIEGSEDPHPDTVGMSVVRCFVTV